jgi:hypothetical protein
LVVAADVKSIVAPPSSIDDGEGAQSSLQFSDPASAPFWNDAERVLFFAGRVVKTFRQMAKNQVLLIVAFQELGWPRRIDDPLPRSHGVEPKQRLREAVRGLNGRQKDSLLVFNADGTGTGVLWRPRS